MAWQYSDYESQATDAERLVRIRLHKQEVIDQIHQDYSVPGRSINTAHLTSLISMVIDPRLKELEKREGITSTATTQGAFVRMRPV